MNEDIVTEFIQFYYKCLNNNTLVDLEPYLKDNSKYIRHDVKLNGAKCILNGITRTDITYAPTKYNLFINGDRIANVMITGNIIQGNSTLNYSEFIMLSISNKKEYWIHSSILHIIN